jgi:uncharacterized repeat protein (TIGR01451 family)
MDAAGGNQRVVYWPGGTNTDAWARSWSPDGRYVAFTRVSFIQQGGTWYWTTAYLDAWDSTNGGSLRLSDNSADWHPDWQIADLVPPTSAVQPLPAQSPATFAISWAGADIGPAGIANYDVQVREGVAGPWSDWQMSTINQTAAYSGIGGHTYYFSARARDHAANVEPWPADYDAATTVETLPPIAIIRSLPTFARAPELPIQWTGSDPGGSGIQNYDVQVRQDTGDWTDWLVGVTETAAPFSGQSGVTYSFRVRGRDQAQNVAAWPVGDAAAITTFYRWRINGRVTDNRSAPVAGMTVNTVPGAFQTTHSDALGAYAAYVVAVGASYTVTWSKADYGNLPGTTFSAAYDPQIDTVLPPVNNIVQDWGFENGVVAQQLSNGAWQFGGHLTGTITNAVRHSGAASAFIGSAASPFRSVIMLAGPEGNRMLNPDAVLDVAGGIHAIWAGPEYGLVYSSKLPGRPWASPTPISGPIVTWHELSRLAIDTHGTLHLVWVAQDGLYYSRKQVGQGWVAPEFLPGTVATYERPQLIVTPGGVVKVAWAAHSSVWYYDVVYGQRELSGIWSVSRIIIGKQLVKMVSDPAGLVHLLLDNPGSAYGDCYYAAETADGSWLLPVQLSGGGTCFSKDLAIDINGTAHIVWSSSDGVYYRSRLAGGSWSQIEQMSPSRETGVSLTADQLGRVHLAWGDKSSGQMRYLVRTNGAWSAPEALASPATLHEWMPPVLVIDENLRVHAMWFQGYNAEIRYAVRNSDGGWSPPVDFGQADGNRQLRLLVDRSGVPYTLWRAGISYAGSSGAVWYAGPEPVQTGGEAALSQAVRVPDAGLAPTLSFLHRFSAEFPSASRLEVWVDDAISPTLVFSTTAGTDIWRHQWADLTRWAGRPVTITFKVVEVAGGARAWAYIDEVSVGSASPDSWVGLTSRGAAPPGQETAHTITYGNRGGVTARNAAITLQLPPELIFVSAQPPPSATTPGLRWDVGDLAGSSAPQMIRVTLRMAATAVRRTTVVTTATVTSDAAEVEQSNNTAQSATFVGYLMRLPIIMR